MNNDIDVLHRIEHEMAIFIRRAEAARIAYFNATGLDRSTYLLLTHLYDNGPLSIKALADTFQLDISTASRQTASLESKGYVERTASPKDARVSLLQVTSSGSGQLLRVRSIRQSFYTELMQEWTLEETANFCDLLQKFNQTVENYSKSNKNNCGKGGSSPDGQ
ncbi:MarR family winged helix-turn-helix transcriptional regulator [Paenibacillus montanisoli]|uniref:MarR family transcriptional regulator n=1 Tax=Paenibacillus montanisoli TaxID=2081970 RepID=A0A328TUJ3_9BACL|nr:MarR family transcriptional regulator [Paenibacillus montanisoli]RAP74177.1 MarR family transcriptional regulator [Paenibacillus montanisoli]